MSEIEIKQMQEKIDAGILLAQKRLIEKTKKEDGELVVVRDGKPNCWKDTTEISTPYPSPSYDTSPARTTGNSG